MYLLYITENNTSFFPSNLVVILSKSSVLVTRPGCYRDEVLVRDRRTEVMAKPKKISIGNVCPVCKASISKRDSRVHVIWHYMDELKEIASVFPDPRQCGWCPYSNPKVEKMAKHLALGHSKLDELLGDQELLARKQIIAANKPQKVNFAQLNSSMMMGGQS